MTIQECYQRLGGDASDAERRLRSVNLVKRFLMKFLDDGSFSALCLAMKEGDRERAFHAAHMLKGVSANLGLNRLLQTVSLLTELLQPEATAIPNEAYLFFEDVKQEYAFSVSAIRAYLNSDQT